MVRIRIIQLLPITAAIRRTTAQAHGAIATIPGITATAIIRGTTGALITQHLHAAAVRLETAEALPGAILQAQDREVTAEAGVEINRII
jgi:hypothetical protein